MIHAVSSNKDSFKAYNFNKGVNVIIKDEKSLLINIIRFCLGCENFKKDLPLRKLKNHEFTLTLDLFGEKISACRAINSPSEIEVNGNFKNFPLLPKNNHYSIKEWKRLLEMAFFKFNHNENIIYTPKFEMLSDYIIRKNSDFKSVLRDKISASFLMGLDWKLISRQKELDDKLKKLSKETAELKDNYGSKGELICEINRLATDINRISLKLEDFKIRKDTDKMKSEIDELVSESVILEKKLKKYNEIVKPEDNQDNLDVLKIYDECNFVFDDKIKATLKDAEKFHRNIIKNRKDFLEDEITSIKNRLDEIDEKISEYKEILNNTGSLNEYNQLQKILFEKKEKLSKLREITKRYDDISRQKHEIKKELFNLELEFQNNYDENSLHLNHLMNLFSENTSKVCGTPGNLIIECSEKGFEFKISKSEINIVCFDLMLAEDLKNIDFLVHDLSAFSITDREKISNLINEKDLQYICTVNPDNFKVIT